MYVNFLQYFLEVIQIESKNELVGLVRKSEFNHILLGDDAEIDNEFYLVKVFDYNKSTAILHIGIISEGLGLKPHMLFDYQEKSIYIGYNSNIAVIKFDVDFDNYFIVNLNSRFYNFVDIEKYHYVLVIKELGISALSYTGREVWSVDTDIIENYKITNDLIIMDLFENSTLKISLVDGSNL